MKSAAGFLGTGSRVSSFTHGNKFVSSENQTREFARIDVLKE